MAAVTPAKLRQRIAHRLQALSGLVEAPVTAERFRAAGRSLVHQEFAVAVSDSTWEGRDRQKATEGTRANTTVRVIVSVQLAAHDERESFDAALDLEAQIRNRLLAQEAGSELAPAWPQDLIIYWRGSTREAAREPGWLYLESTFQVLHLLPLQ